MRRFGNKKVTRKLVSVFLSAVLACGMLAGCGSKDTSTVESGTVETETVENGEAENTSQDSGYAEKKVLRVGMECAYAPFNWTQESEELSNGDKARPIYGTNLYCYGYDVMMANKIAEKLGWDVEVHKVEWDSIGISMDAGDYDCIIAGMSWSEEREAAYDFTDVYYYRDVCLTVKKGSEWEGITSLDEFAGKNPTVTTQLGTAFIGLISQIPDAQEAAFYETTSEAFMAVSNGVADIALIDKPTAESALLTNDDLTILDIADIESGDSVNVCIAVRSGDDELKNLIQGAMDDMGWDRAQMDEMMTEAVKLQPAAE